MKFRSVNGECLNGFIYDYRTMLLNWQVSAKKPPSNSEQVIALLYFFKDKVLSSVPFSRSPWQVFSSNFQALLTKQ